MSLPVQDTVSTGQAVSQLVTKTYNLSSGLVAWRLVRQDKIRIFKLMSIPILVIPDKSFNDCSAVTRAQPARHSEDENSSHLSNN